MNRSSNFFKDCWRNWISAPNAWILTGAIVGWSGFYAYLVHQMAVMTNQGLVARLITIWGDWPAHLTMTTRMAYGETLLPSENPLLIGSEFVYPFFINLVSALLIKAGVPFLLSFTLPHALSIILLIGGLGVLYKYFFNSSLTAVVALSVLITTGGLGYLSLDVGQSWNTLTSSAQNANQNVTFLQTENIEFGALSSTLLLPQRALPLGVVAGLLCLWLTYRCWFSNISIPNKRLAALGAGIIIALLPLLHLHTFLAVGILLSCWAVGSLLQDIETQRGKNWLSSCWPLLVLGLLAVIWHGLRLRQATTDSTVLWQPGWYSESLSDWLIFWWRNWGIIPLAALAGWLILLRQPLSPLYSKLSQAARISIPGSFFVLFLISNLFIFQPYIWDNTKLFFWVAIGFSGLASYFFVWTVQRACNIARLSNKIVATASICLLLGISVLGGSYDTFSILSKTPAGIMHSNQDLEIATWVRQNTSANSIWLTGDRHNHWVSNLTGRQVVMTYPGWLWTHGLDYSRQQEAVYTLYTSPNRTDLIRAWGIDYAVIGDYEKNQLEADPNTFMQFHQLIYQTEEYFIFKLNK